MKLYSAPLSLFAKKVEIALVEKDIAFERVLVPFNQTTGYAPKHPDVLAANPKGQVPVLIDGGLTLYDSTVILEYLEEACPQPSLYPPSPVERARCRLYDLFADEVMLVPLRALMHRNGPRPNDPSQWLALEEAAKGAVALLAAQFGQLEDALADQSHFCGDLSVADIALFMAVLYVQRLAGPGLADYPRLAAWYRRLKARPAFARVVADIARADRELSEPVEGAHGDAV